MPKHIFIQAKEISQDEKDIEFLNIKMAG